MHYDILKNAKCDIGSPRDRWAKLGRNQSSQCSSAIDEYGRLFTWGQNYYGQSGQGSRLEDSSKYEIEFCSQIGAERNWVKVMGQEYSCMALNELGELWVWGDNAEDGSQWGYDPGVAPSIAYTPIRAADGYFFKDFAYGYYYTIAVGIDNKLYSFGVNDDYSLGIGEVEGSSYKTPVLNPYITEDIKFIDTELYCTVVVTESDKVYAFGCNWWYTHTVWDGYWTGVPWEVTGLVIPAGETIVGASVCYGGITVVLSDGTVWKVGNDGLLLDTSNYYTDGSTEFEQLSSLAGKYIVKSIVTALGSFAHFVLDNKGNIWGYSDTSSDFWIGNSHTPILYGLNLVGAEEEDNRKYIDFCSNETNLVWMAIDHLGYLWTWGYQWWGPHLGIGAKSYTSSGTADSDDYPKVYASPVPIKAAVALDYKQEQTTLNAIDYGESPYIQPIGQSLRHRPCGHWHLRLFERGEEYPINCWMPSLALRSSELFFIASGKHWYSYPETGNEILFLSYDIGQNIWTTIGYDDKKYAANYPGGADFRGNIYGYMNYKVDQIGSQWNEAYDNPAMGVWVINRATDTLEYNEFTDAKAMSGIDKIGVFSTGMVAVAYENTSNELVIYVSTDNGATFNLMKTITTLAGSRSFSLTVDAAGYIYIAYQISTSSVRVERSINQGVTWTTQVASTTIITGLLDIKLVEDASYLYILGRSFTQFRSRYSSNAGVTWGTAIAFTQPPYPSVVAHSCFPGSYNHCVAYDGSMWNYYYDTIQAHYDWIERTIQQIDGEGDWVNVDISENLSTLVGNVGVYAYAAWGFFLAIRRAVAVAISMDQGAHWFLRETPLKYYTDYTELTQFDGDPLFYLTDVPYLNPKWSFEKSNWNTEFIKQKDKY